ncbi:MAG TPA: glycosyl transferase family 2, partial [Cytophagales bacterium]|nr:glycosyl transferase family 2 [Cytophagales bacterium]
MEYWWVLWTGVYSLGLFWATWKWKGINANPTLLADFPTVSVLVPARNESNNLPKLLQSLSRQVYPSYWEVIVIDDHSEDNTVEVARSFQKGLELRAISLADTAWGQGKKAAITAGMDAASGDVVITTDADCWMDSGWLARMGSSFHSPSVQLAFGPVTFPVHNFWERWQALEFWSLIGIGAVTWQAKSPSMCNGANLAVRKEAFYEVGGYDASKDIPSGDDEFLLHAIVDRFGEKSTQFVKDKSALV